MINSKDPSDNPQPAEQAVVSQANLDPLSGAAGAHPIGTALGGASGAVAGAVAGIVAGGPVGAVIGAVVGVVAGGLAGKSLGESVNPTDEDLFWRARFVNEPYYEKGRRFADYAPAYRTGYETYVDRSGRTFDELESELMARYERNRGSSPLNWSQARLPARAAWTRAARTSRP